MTNQECKVILDAVGACLCGHGESCNVCTRSEASRAIEHRCQLQLKQAGCGTKWPHKFALFNICTYCGFWKQVKKLKLRRRT